MPRFLSSFSIILMLTIASCMPLNIANAGSQQSAQIKHAPEAIAAFSKGLEKYAAEQGARAFIIARVGRPANDLPKGITYTHTAIAIYSSIQLNNGEIVNGYAIHNLYQDAQNLDRSKLIVDYPVDFFWGAHELKAGIIIPTPQIQQALIELVSTNKHTALHNPAYSVLANPFNSQFQNCTEFTLDLLNAAIYSTSDIPRLKANARAHFTPQRVRISRFKLFLGAVFMDDFTSKDHKGKVKTATFTSIARYLHKYHLAEQAVSLNNRLISEAMLFE